MATATAKKTATKRTATKRRPADRVAAWFLQFLQAQDEVEVLEKRSKDLRDRILQVVETSGYEDDKGSRFLDLTQPVEFKDHEGNVTVFKVLKKERHLSPASPLPEPAKAEALLRTLKLWIKPAQEKTIKEIALANPYIKVSITVDPDAVAQAYFKGLITEEDYDAILVEQRESFQFRKLTK
jgi:hypothetical protein